MTRFMSAAMVAMAAVVNAGCDISAQGIRAEGSFERTLPVSGAADVSIVSRSGSIHVTSGGGNEVRVVGHIRAYGALTYTPASQVQQIMSAPPIEQRGNTISIGRIDDWMLASNVRISYEVTVPRDARLRTSSRSGDQTFLAVLGPVDASSRSGPISIDGLRGALRVGSRSGDISVQGEPSEAWDIQTRSGDVELRVPASAGFDVQVATRSGSIDTAQTVEATGSFARREFSGKVRGGGPRVAVATRSGSVRIQ